jgi:peptidoglycan hydrolase CwlO-like protein
MEMEMTFGSATRFLVVLTATAAFTQTAQPGATSGTPMMRQVPSAKGPVTDRATDPLGLSEMRERVNDMESTLSRMRGVLKQMHAKTSLSKVPDSLTKANLDLWELMVGHLDNELEQLRVTLATRENMEERRVALYKQADTKIAAANQAARAAQAARFAEAQKNATGIPTPAAPEPVIEQGAAQSPAAQTVPTQPSRVQPSSSPASPN